MRQKKYLLYAAQNYSFAILRPLQEAIRQSGGQAQWFLMGNEINHQYLTDDEIKLNSIEEVIEFQPDAVFVPGNVVPTFIPGFKVAVFHGFNAGKLNRRGKLDHFNIRGCFDLYCTQGPNTTATFDELANKYKHFSVKETGWPAIDPLYLSESLQKNEKPTILLCSTFSRNLSCAETLFEKVKELSTTGRWNWLVQFHPKMASSTVEKYKSIQGDNLVFVETDNVIPLLQKADVMVCDTSSVLTMFLLLNKPVVTFKNSNPKGHLIDIDNVDLLEPSIDRALQRPDDVMEPIVDFIEQTHPYKDGLSSQRVLNAVDELLEGSNLPKKSKPLNLVRAFKMRKSLNYWKL